MESGNGGQKKDKQIEENKNVFFTPKSANATTLKFSHIRQRIFERFRAKEYQKLKEDLVQYKKEESQIKEFFRQEGHTIVDWAVSKTPDTGALDFLCNPENLDKDILKQILLSNNLQILEDFLLIQSGREEMGSFDETGKQCQIKKFELLLKIDQEAVCAFMQKNTSQEYMTKEIKENFLSALKGLQEKQSQPAAAFHRLSPSRT